MSHNGDDARRSLHEASVRRLIANLWSREFFYDGSSPLKLVLFSLMGTQSPSSLKLESLLFSYLTAFGLKRTFSSRRHD